MVLRVFAMDITVCTPTQLESSGFHECEPAGLEGCSECSSFDPRFLVCDLSLRNWKRIRSVKRGRGNAARRHHRSQGFSSFKLSGGHQSIGTGRKA